MKFKNIARTFSYTTTIGAGVGLFAAVIEPAHEWPENLFDGIKYWVYPSLGAGIGFALGLLKALIHVIIEATSNKEQPPPQLNENGPR